MRSLRALNLIYAVLAVLMVPLFASGQNVNSRFELREGRSHLIDGVNCHSTSLQAAGLLDYPTHVDADELIFVLRTQCEKISRPEAGVIGFYGGRSMSSHSFFHISSNETFEKKNLKKGTPYRVVRRGFLRGAEYYKCERRQTACNYEKLSSLKRRIRRIGLYYANLAVVYDNHRATNSYFDLLKRTETQLKSLAVPQNCAWDKQRLLYRASSLMLFANSSRTVNLILQRMPHPGRD